MSKNNWISVEDKLPEAYTRILALYENGYIEFNVIPSDQKFSYERLYGKVTHWQPLPAAPSDEPEEVKAPTYSIGDVLYFPFFLDDEWDICEMTISELGEAHLWVSDNDPENPLNWLCFEFGDLGSEFFVKKEDAAAWIEKRRAENNAEIC